MGKFGDAEVESRIVYQYHHVRIPLQNVGKTLLEAVEIRFRFQKHLYETDDRPVFIVLNESSTALVSLIYVIHKVAAPETDIGLRVLMIQSLHQIRSVKIA